MPVDRRANVEECEVNGAFLLTIRLQRWVGLAPVHIRKRGSQYFISRCRLYIYLGYLFSIINCVLLLVAIFWDISIKATLRTVNFGSTSRSVLWLMNITNCLVTYFSGCFGAEKRMTHLMSYVKEINQIKLHLKNEREQWNKIKSVLLIFNYLSLIIFIVMQYCITFINIENTETEMIIFHLNIFENTQYLLMFLSGISYKNTVQLFNTTLHLINRHFEHILSDVKNNVSQITEETNARVNPPQTFSTKSVNRAIDQLGVTELKRPASALSEEKEEMLHQLLRQQDRVCVLIARFNKRDGLLILSVIFTFITCIVALSYNIISTIYAAEINYYWILYYCHLIFWLIWLIINTMIIVKACQQTATEEMYTCADKTFSFIGIAMSMMVLTYGYSLLILNTILNKVLRHGCPKLYIFGSLEQHFYKDFIRHILMTAMKMLVSYFMNHIANGNDPLYNVLDTYYHRLRLHNVGYSPFGLFQLNEHFIFTLMGAVSTYLFIFTDFHIDAGFIRKEL